MTSSYISRAACHGKRPTSSVAEAGQQRAHLIASLLKERSVARFIVAPSGYGKTSLAFEYAETIFDWAHTFWFNAQSPCFIRDLDAQSLAASCLDFDNDAALAVFDDVPFLDTDRAELFSTQIDMLLEAGCEVVVTARPTCNIAGYLQRDRISIEAFDLLLSDDELEAFYYQHHRKNQRVQDIPQAYRVPALIWGSCDENHGEDIFKKRVLSEDVPQDVYNVMASILLLQKNTLEALSSLTTVDAELLETLRHDYPHLGISASLDSFDAVPLEAGVLGGLMKSRMGAIVERSSCSTESELLEAWTDMLLQSRQASRACELMHVLATRQAAAEWLIANQREIIRQACFHQTLLIARNTTNLNSSLKAQLGIIEALCCQILADTQMAVQHARRLAVNGSLGEQIRSCAHLILFKLGTREDYEQALHYFESLEDLVGCGEDQLGAEDEWKLLVWMRLVGADDPQVLARAWMELYEKHASDDVLCIGAAWIFACYAQHVQKDQQRTPCSELATVQNYIRTRLEDPDNLLDFYAVSAGLSMEEAHERGMAYSSGMMSVSILFGLRQFELALMVQRSDHARELREEEARQTQWNHVRSDGSFNRSALSEVRATQHVPQLSLRLFGTLEVSIGDTPMDDKGALKNHNARTLLAVLAVNQGKEVSRETIAHTLWPDSPSRVANKNFYTIWARLRQTLALPDGSCPYLVRHKYGCSLAQRYVTTDIERFNEICRTLLFGVVEHNDWSDFFCEIDRNFSSELLPGETRNRLIITARQEFRDKLVDALVSASVGNLDAGEPKWGICFAREALRRDDTREDAYIALMRSQAAFSQRTSAIMTYLRCQKTLGERLGIDPSPEASMLYQELLAGDEE